MTVIFGDITNEAVAFIRDRLGVDYSDGCDLAVMVSGRDRQLVGVIVAEFKTYFDAHITVACDQTGAIGRRTLKAVFTALFTRAVRVTALIEPENKQTIRLAKRLGFHHEGYGRKMIEGRRDALIFGMLKEECIVLRARGARVSRETKVNRDGLQPETPGPV